MNSFMEDLFKILKEHISKQRREQGYIIKEIKQYTDLENNKNIAIKFKVRGEEKEEVIILSYDFVDDVQEDKIEWFNNLIGE